MAISVKSWGSTMEGEASLITLACGDLEVSLTNFGATIVSLKIKTGQGRYQELVLGYDTLEGYVSDPYYMGCTVGRFANRISGAAFSIDGKPHRLTVNEPANHTHLHGGLLGFNKRMFSVHKIDQHAAVPEVQFRYLSRDGEEGYPGNLELFVSFRLNADNELVVAYEATTDRPTPVNLTNHSYFNLSGSEDSAAGHEVFINAGEAVTLDYRFLPTGGFTPVGVAVPDLRRWRPIATPNDAAFVLNECYVLQKDPAGQTAVAGLRHPATGIALELFTTKPGIILYNGHYLDKPFKAGGGICLEPQFFPDSPNQPGFPDTILRPGAVYKHDTVYRFLQLSAL